MISAENITKSFDGFTALNNLSVHIEKGSIYGLVGVNGAGKTTLIKHITGIYKADTGVIEIDGQNVWDNVSVKERIGYIPDELYFFQNYTLAQAHSFYKNLYKKWNEDLYKKMIGDFGLKENGRIAKFSKGMQKQAAFALTLATMPDYLILDEPVDGLDPIMRKKVWSYVLSEVADREMTVLISSHNLRELEGICDSIGILSQGQLRFEGKLDDLKNIEEGMTLEELFFYEMEDRQ